MIAAKNVDTPPWNLQGKSTPAYTAACPQASAGWCLSRYLSHHVISACDQTRKNLTHWWWVASTARRVCCNDLIMTSRQAAGRLAKQLPESATFDSDRVKVKTSDIDAFMMTSQRHNSFELMMIFKSVILLSQTQQLTYLTWKFPPFLYLESICGVHFCRSSIHFPHCRMLLPRRSHPSLLSACVQIPHYNIWSSQAQLYIYKYKILYLACSGSSHI